MRIRRAPIPDLIRLLTFASLSPSQLRRLSKSRSISDERY